MREGYELFVNTVARGRDMTFEEVDAIGQGRVWSGADALELGLVDFNGGVVDAITHAGMLAGMGTDIPEIRVYPEVSGLGSLNLSPFGTGTLAEPFPRWRRTPFSTPGVPSTWLLSSPWSRQHEHREFQEGS